MSGVNSGPHISAPIGQRKNNFDVPRAAPSVSIAQSPSARPVARRRVAVGRNPQPTRRIDRAVVRHAEPAVLGRRRIERRTDRRNRRIAAFHQDLPLECRRRVIATVRHHLDDVAEAVRRARVRGVDLIRPCAASCWSASRRPCWSWGWPRRPPAGPSWWRRAASAASRAWIRTSAWLLKPFACGQRPWPCTSGSHSPVPSSL